MGWRGINIDAMPNCMRLFNKIRPRDINLEVAISEKKGKLTYYTFNEPALNSFIEELSQKRVKESNHYKIVFTKEMETKTLEEVLDKFLTVKKIDFLNIDVEGMDYSVLKSNNWKKYIPDVVLCEISNFNIKNLQNNEQYMFLVEKGYKLYAITNNSLIFKHHNFSQ